MQEIISIEGSASAFQDKNCLGLQAGTPSSLKSAQFEICLQGPNPKIVTYLQGPNPKIVTYLQGPKGPHSTLHTKVNFTLPKKLLSSDSNILPFVKGFKKLILLYFAHNSILGCVVFTQLMDSFIVDCKSGRRKKHKNILDISPKFFDYSQNLMFVQGKTWGFSERAVQG